MLCSITPIFIIKQIQISILPIFLIIIINKMIGYSFTANKKLLFTVLVYTWLISLSTSTGQDPKPNCRAGFYYQTLPLIANQAAIINLDSLFGGYNLNFELKGQQQWAKHIDLGQKIIEQGHYLPDVQMVGLKNHHLQRIGNSWGTSFVAISERGDKTYIHYGFLDSSKSAPVINYARSVEQFANTTCFDAVMFTGPGLILVDCVVKLPKEDQFGYIYQNKFIYLNMSDGEVLKKQVKTEMFIPFTQVTQRKLVVYENPLSSHLLLLRSYLQQGVDKQHANNTYIDVFMVSQPLDPWIVEIVDRSSLKQKQLYINDVSVYLGEVYVLDYKKGLHRLRFNDEEDLLYQGFYQGKKFTDFAVYSNNLDDKFELALSSNNAIYQIDWSDLEDPRLINKYTLMPGSNISQIFLNQRFIFVQATSKADSGITYNYTWVMNRGDRTYTKAFQVLKHSTFNTRIDLNLQQTYLIVIDDQRIVNYALDQANLILKLPKDEDYIDRMMSFTIVAKSKQPSDSTQTQVTCQIVLNFTLLEDNNRTMWPSGAFPPSFYNANYPGKIEIPLYEYVLGPNITYRIEQIQKGDIKSSKIFKQDQLKIFWETQIPFEQKQINFLQTQTINYNSDNDILLMYLQDSDNITYFGQCFPNHEDIDIRCTLVTNQDLQGVINNWATTIFVSRYTLKIHHIIAYTTEKHYNRVYLRQITSRTQHIEMQVDLGKGYAGNVTGVEVYGKYMFVNLKYYKSIQVYDLQLCLQDFCQPICIVDYLIMYKLGVKFFSPEKVQVSEFFPNVLFIKNVDSIIALDMNRQCVPKLLSVIHPVVDTKTQFSFMISLNHLIVTAIPNQVIQYDISRVFLKQIKQTKRYPLYGYKLPKNYDTDVSQYGQATFVTTVSQGGDYQVFIYRPGYPAIATLFDVIDLFTYKPILVDASGSFIDYLTVYSGKELRIFRQYILPVAELATPNKDFGFYLEYFNVVEETKLQIIQVEIINLPMSITVNPQVQDIMKTKDLLYSGQNVLSEINDTLWYNGNVLKIQSDCRDCEQTVLVMNHIHYQGSVEYIPGLFDYEWDRNGGSLQAQDMLLLLNHDGQIRDFSHFPDSKDVYCIKTSLAYGQPYQVSACVSGQSILLYLTSKIAHKSFTSFPYDSRAEQIQTIQAVHELIMIVDSSTNPFFKTRPGGIILYSINFDDEEEQIFQQIQYIDGSDFSLSTELYIHSASLNYVPQTKTYRLYITEIRFGVLILEFSYLRGQTEITILKENFININQLLTKGYNIAKPYDSTYQGIKVARNTYDASLKQSKDQIVITLGTYNTLLISVIYNIGYEITSYELTKMFMRYAYFVVLDQIKINNRLLLLKQQLPTQYDKDNMTNSTTKQILTVYDLDGTNFKNSSIQLSNPEIQDIGLIGAYTINDRVPRNFDFNLTFNRSDMHNQPRVNLALIQQFAGSVDQMSLHRNLSVFTRQKVDTQIIYIDLINDFDLKKIRILLNGYAPFPQWKLITIILFSIIAFLILAAATFVGVKKIQAKRRDKTNYSQEKPISDKRQSLMTDESIYDRYSYSR